MADNVAITAGAGTSIATDDAGGVHFQRVKLVDGTLDGTDAIPGTAENGLDVDVTRLPALVAGSANIGDVDVLTVPAPLSTTGGGTEATALRVTLASDSTGVVSIDDNGASLTVDATDLDIRNLAPATDTVAIGDGAATATIRNLAANDALNVAIVDAAGDQITSFGGGTQYTEDAAAPANPVAPATSLVRQDTPATLTDTDGDIVAQRGTNYGAAFTQIVTSAGAFVDSFGGGTQYADAAARGTATGTIAMVDDGTNIQSMSGDSSGRPNVNIATALPAGTNNIGDIDVLSVPAPLSTTGGGTEATALRVTLASDSTGLVSVDDNAGSLTVDAPVGTPVNVQIGNATLTVGVVDETGASAVDTIAVGGGTPHDSVNSGNPVLNGFEAIAHGTNPTAVAAADRTKSYANRAGIPFVIGGHPNVQTIRLQFTAAQTDVAIITVGAGAKIVVTALQVTLDNASTVFPSCRIGFGTANTPTTSGVIAAHGGIPAGGGFSRGDGSGIIGVGADNEDLRITTVGTATGNGVEVIVTYYTIES